MGTVSSNFNSWNCNYSGCILNTDVSLVWMKNQLNAETTGAPESFVLASSVNEGKRFNAKDSMYTVCRECQC